LETWADGPLVHTWFITPINGVFHYELI